MNWLRSKMQGRLPVVIVALACLALAIILAVAR